MGKAVVHKVGWDNRDEADARQIFPNRLRANRIRELRPRYVPPPPPPSAPSNSLTDIFIDSTPLELSLWDTAGQEEFDRLRSLSYDDTHAIMLCFAVDNPDSLENVESKWVGEIADNCPGVKLVLVALKCDLREEEEGEEGAGGGEGGNGGGGRKGLITYDQGLEVAKRIGALRY